MFMSYIRVFKPDLHGDAMFKYVSYRKFILWAFSEPNVRFVGKYGDSFQVFRGPVLLGYCVKI